MGHQQGNIGRTSVNHVDRDDNQGADVLSKLGSTRANVPPGLFVQELHFSQNPKSLNHRHGGHDHGQGGFGGLGRLVDSLHRLHQGVQASTRH